MEMYKIIHFWLTMTSYPIRWNGVPTDYVAISTSVHTFVRMYECVCVAAEWGAQSETYD